MPNTDLKTDNNNFFNLMKKIKAIFTLCVFAVLIATGIEMQRPDTYISTAMLENIQALSESESGSEGGGLDCSYNRKTGQCTIFVGAHGKIEIFGFGILEANGEGKVVVDAEVVCYRDGDATCKPFECYELYALIANSEKK